MGKSVSGCAMKLVSSSVSYMLLLESLSVAYFVILSSIDLGSKMNVGRTTLLRSAPGRSWEMI